MILLYILPLLFSLFVFFGLCCMDNSTTGRWIHIIALLCTLTPGLNIVWCAWIIFYLWDEGVDSSDFIRCKKFWIWFLGNN